MQSNWKRLLLVCPDSNIYSISKFNPTIYPNLGLEYLYSNIEDIIEVDYIDLRFFSIKHQDKALQKKLQKFKPNLVGIYSITPFIRKTLKIARLVKSFGADVVCGGWHPTIYPDEALEPEEIDLIIRGEGEHTLRELIRNGHPENVLGVSYKKDGKKIHNGERPLEQNLDSFKYPSRTYRKDWFYRDVFRDVDYIITSRGCPHSCLFCSTPLFFKNTWRGRSVSNIIEELELIKKIGKCNEITIFDDNFTVDAIRVSELCDEIIRRKLNFKFNCLSRPEFIANNPDLIAKMKKAGFWAMLIGFESFNPEVLETLNKRVKISNYFKAIQILRENKMMIHGTYIIGGSFNETRDDVLRTLYIIKKFRLEYYAKSYISSGKKMIYLTIGLLRARGVRYFLNLKFIFHILKALPSFIKMKLLQKYKKDY